MKSGALRRYVAIEQNKAATTDFGDQGPADWQPIDYVWAGIEDYDARRYSSADVDRSGSTHTIFMRYYPDFDASWRINDDGVIYEILGFWNKNARDRETVISARVGVSDG